jgi:hypothetical protein
MKIAKIAIAGILFAIISQIVNMAEAMGTMNFYTDSAYIGVWSKIMMPGIGAPPAEFYYYSIVFNVITGIIYAIVFTMIGKSLAGEKVLKQGLKFGMLLYLIGIPFTLTLYLLINLPAVLLVYWSVASLAVDLIGGVAIARILK